MNVTLDNIARSYLHKSGRNVLHGYPKILSFLVEFARKISSSTVYMQSSGTFKVDEKMCIQMPEDFLLLNMIGYVSGDRIVKFERDNTIALTHSYCDDAASATNNSEFNIGLFDSGCNFNFLDCLLTDPAASIKPVGRGHNGSGYFKVNYAAREIQLSTDAKVSGDVFMSYSSNGFNPRTRTAVPEFCQEAAEAYVRWQEARWDRRLGDAAAETEARRVRYIAAIGDMVASTDNLDYEAIQGVLARAFDIRKIAR